MNNIEIAKGVLKKELLGIEKLLGDLPKDLNVVIELIVKCKGRVIFSGIGKSGYICQKLTASFASTGTSAIYIHPAEASHGDLGMISNDDIVIMMSNSGETKELNDIANYCKRFNVMLILITMNEKSSLAKNCNYLLNIPKVSEASSLNAPTVSSTMMLALGDAIMVAVHEAKGFTKNDFSNFHPGGKLGASMIKIEELMHDKSSSPIVYCNTLMSDVILEISSKGFGCTAVLDNNDKLVGIITDGDLRRHMQPNLLMFTAAEIMTANPRIISKECFAGEALSIMETNKITSIFIANDKSINGIIHIHDLLRIGVK